MKPLPPPPLHFVRCLFAYDPETGTLRNRLTGSTGFVHQDGYVRVSIRNKTYPASRIIWWHIHGEWPDGDIDHINRVKADNRLANLRVLPRSENVRRSQRPYRSTTGCRGIATNKRGKPYRANIDIRGKKIHLGCFDTIEEAVAARRAAELQHNCVTD